MQILISCSHKTTPLSRASLHTAESGGTNKREQLNFEKRAAWVRNKKRNKK